MTSKIVRRPAMLAASVFALLASGAFSTSASAQTENGTVPPSRFVLDPNGINLATGYWQERGSIASIGSGDGQLSVREVDGSIERLGAVLTRSGSNWTAVVAGRGDYHSETFTLSGSTFTSTMGDGASLSLVGSNYVLTLADGTRFTYGYTVHGTNDSSAVIGRLSEIDDPSGSKETMSYVTGTYCTTLLDSCSGGTYVTKVRLQGVQNSFGYQLHYNYVSDQLDTPAKGTKWDQLSSITLLNSAVDACDPAAATCSYSQSWPTVTTSWLSGSFTDPAGRHTTNTYAYGPPATRSITRPGSSSPDTVITYDSNARVTSVATDGRTWNYQFTLSGNTMTAVVTNPDGTHRTVVSDTTIGLPTSVTDENNHHTSYAYDTSGRLAQTTLPTGRYVVYGRDGRGNVTSTVVHPSSGSGTINTSASFPSTCSNAITCNLPISTTDANGNVTNYGWDPTYGVLTSVTLPADGSGVRPQTRYSYLALQAYYKNPTGTLVASGTPAVVLTGISQCMTGSSCIGTANEARTVISYGPQNGTANNLLPVSVTNEAGDGSLTATTGYSYDAVGNVTTIDGPLAGTADITAIFYDGDRELSGVIFADPDGSGPLQNRAQRVTYNSDGLVTLKEFGTASGESAAALLGMTVLQSLSTSYDVSARKTRDVVTAGGTTYGVTDYSYDSVGRPDCTAVRMNPAAWGTVTAACTAQTAGSAGPDRITKSGYDAAGQLTSVTTAYGVTGTEATESTAYTPNGKIASVTDGNNNTTSYAYDGFDRLSTTTYPGGSYEQLTYDGPQSGSGNGLVTSLRRRDGSSIGYTYDHLNRMTFEDRVNQGIDEDVTNNYDLLGRLTYTSTPHGHKTAFGYDALGRRVSETTTYGGVKTSMYDAAGRRTRLTWPDGFYVSYDYDTLGEMTAVRENGATSGVGVLATYAYDDLGNRKSITRGNGVTTTYGYDPVSRLTSLVHDLAGTASDESVSFTYNPAGQIASRTGSNDAYAWNGAVNVNRAYTTNALNQYTASGGVALGYDANGNLTSSGASTYAYGQHNQLYSAAGATLYYDPLDRLDVISDNVTNPTFDYDGANLATERTYGSSTITRRYVFGADVDEPLVWYEGSGTSDRRWLIADERGSVIAVTDGSGNATAINTYDEYGIPGANNQGRFQYTGQIWLPQLGMYYYKARMYSPSLGRFMQTDAIGYADGLNWYNYVGGDPVNAIDPSGNSGAGVDHNSEICTGTRLCSWEDADGTGGSDSGGCLSCDIHNGSDYGPLPLTYYPGAGGPASTDSNGNIVVTGSPGYYAYGPGLSLQNSSPQNNDIVVTCDAACQFRKGVVKIIEDDPAVLLGRLIVDTIVGTPACCFTAGTLVSTPSGLKPIETLKVGDMVMSRSPDTGKTAAKPITAIIPAHERRIWTVTISYKGDDGRWRDETYETTDNHPWRSTDGRWVVSASLKAGQALARENGTAIVVKTVDSGKTKLTYNLTIADFHTYFVGKAETWVHNSCPSFLRNATKKELGRLANRDGFNSIEEWKTRHLGLNSRYNIGIDKFNGNVYSYPLRGGEAEFLGINIYGR